jgi:hypothetical protein
MAELDLKDFNKKRQEAGLDGTTIG